MIVAIIGAGPLGRGLALAAARAGFAVRLEDVMPANLHHAQEYLRAELGPEGMVRAHATGVSFASTIEEAVRDADLAIDCVPDELESKLEIFCLLDRMAPPHTVLLTPTTRLSITDLAACTYRPTQCVAIAAAPQQLSGTITTSEESSREILLRTTAQTSPQTSRLVREFWMRIGFEPRFEQETF